MIKHTIRALAISLCVALVSPTYAQDTDVIATIVEQSDGTRALVHEAVIDAPVATVWASLSTEEGWKAWGPRFAKFDFRLGGSIETAYHADAKSGDPNNIRHRILAFVPERMIALQIEQAPANGPADPELLKNLWGVYELEPAADGKTRLRISGLGYGADAASSQLLDFFKSGNVYSISLLRRNLAQSE